MTKGAEERLLGEESLKQRVVEEQKRLWRVGGPAILMRLSSFGMFVVTQAFIGRMGEVELAAYAIIQTIFLRFANGILLGMASALVTFCGQAHGAKQYAMLGVFLQRSWIVLLPVATVLVFPYVFAAPLLRLLGQSDDLVQATAKIALWFIPVNYYFLFYFTLQMFLEAQLKNSIIAWLAGGSFILHVIISWVAVEKLDMGTEGAMSALIISCWLPTIGELAYVFGGGCSATWKGFSKAALNELWPMTKLSFSSGIMLCLELWYNSILLLLVTYMKDSTIAVSAFSICLNMIAWVFMISLGFLTSACVRVANELGRGCASAAKFAIKVISLTSLAIGLMFSSLFLALGGTISFAFVSSQEVAETVASLKVYLSISVLLNSLQPVLSGVAIGAAWQSIVGYVNIGCYYCVGIPLGVVLGYVINLGVKGVWIGMICGVAAQTLVLVCIAIKTDWERQVHMASERLKRWSLGNDKDGESGSLLEDSDNIL